jgi:aspartyl-tRNA(Asn)/glutamyl-tRNA(Gln) amidotransferase subunit C
MTLTRQQVEHVANLAKLALTEKEIDLYRKQLSDILKYAAVLESLETDLIPPTASVLPLRNVVREDEAEAGLQQADALANAPSANEGYFQVKSILE